MQPAVERAAAGQSLSLETGNGRVLALSGPAANVFVADPRVAEVRPASTNSLFVFGVGPGRTTIAAMDAQGHAISQFEVTVRASTFAASEAEAMVARLVPNGRVKVTPQARGVILTGNVEHAGRGGAGGGDPEGVHAGGAAGGEPAEPCSPPSR